MKYIRHKRSRSASAAAAGCVAALALAPAAHADTAVFYEGNLTNSQGVGSPYFVYLSEVSARQLSTGGKACVTARNTAGGFVGSPDCVSTYNAVAVHPYCSCELRQGYVFNGTTSTLSVRARYDFS
ncbi:hypothetical protein AB0L40_14430 [Patulibacter sp. NPDC049589]|uniref:hypothetical protein n=1 Tax=Patulibacter sp. NPDC049589 TaxID=3154731 RepID=UPI00343D4E4C